MKLPMTPRECADCGGRFEARQARLCPGCRWRHRGKHPKYVWTPERDAILREKYDSRVRRRATSIASAFGWPGWVIKRRARALGLAGERAPWQDWTPAEVQFLEDHAGTRHVNWISKQLGRTLTSVVLKLKRIHLSRRVREGYSLGDLEMALGIDHRRLADLVEQGKLRAARQGSYPRDRWTFTERDVLAFLRGHPTAYRLARVDQLWFLDLVFRGRIGNETRAA